MDCGNVSCNLKLTEAKEKTKGFKGLIKGLMRLMLVHTGSS